MAARTPRQAQLAALLADAPDDPELRYGYAMEFVSAGDLESAVTHLNQLISERPYVPAYLQSGQVLLRLDRSDEAADVLRAGILEAKKQANEHAAGEMQGILMSIE